MIPSLPLVTQLHWNNWELEILFNSENVLFSSANASLSRAYNIYYSIGLANKTEILRVWKATLTQHTALFCQASWGVIQCVWGREGGRVREGDTDRHPLPRRRAGMQ